MSSIGLDDFVFWKKNNFFHRGKPSSPFKRGRNLTENRIMTESNKEKKVKRVYVDTSVVLGNFDIDETRRMETELFWNVVRNGEIIAIVSDVLDGELKKNMVERVQNFFAELPETQFERIVITDEAKELAEQYIVKNVVGSGSRNDCRHVALATIIADGIVSWNLGDMVKRADKYNSVNMTQNYPEIKIVTPNKYKEIYNET